VKGCDCQGVGHAPGCGTLARMNDADKLRAELEAARADRDFERRERMRLDELRADLVAERDAARDELRNARAEIKELRQAVVAMCDTYSANRDEKLRVKAFRAVAAKEVGAFSLAAVEARRAELEQLDRGEPTQLRARTALTLAEDIGEALAAIEKTPGIDVAIKTLRYVQDVLEQRGKGS
jgi:hypothetical protein